MLIFLLQAADSAAHGSVSQKIDLMAVRTALLKRTFGEVRSLELATLSQNRSLAEICEWPVYKADYEMFGVSCTEDVLTTLIIIGNRTIGNIHYEYLPADLEYLSIYSCDQNFELHTRLLPRCLRELNFGRNEICGTVDLQTLPPHLERFDASVNQIVGPIALTDLPKTLTSLLLYSNRIKQRIVPCDPLPAGMAHLDLRDNKIREVHIQMDQNGGHGGHSPIQEVIPGVKVKMV